MTITKWLLQAVTKLPLKTENQRESTIYWPEKNAVLLFFLLSITHSQMQLHRSWRQDLLPAVVQVPHSPAVIRKALEPITHLEAPCRGSSYTFGVEILAWTYVTQDSPGSPSALFWCQFPPLPMTSRFPDFMDQLSCWCFLILAVGNHRPLTQRSTCYKSSIPDLRNQCQTGTWPLSLHGAEQIHQLLGPFLPMHSIAFFCVSQYRRGRKGLAYIGVRIFLTFH